MSTDIRKRADQSADWINLVLGIVLLVSPWVFEYSGQMAAALTAWVGGGMIAIMALFALANFGAWEEWTNVVIGLWVAASPWLLGFTALSPAMWIHLALGGLVAVLAAWRGWGARAGQGGEHLHA